MTSKKYLKFALPFMAMMFVAFSADAATYYFTNTVDNAVATTANWGVKPADDDTTATVSMEGVDSGSTIDFGTGEFSWNDLYMGLSDKSYSGETARNWGITGGTLSLESGDFRVSDGTFTINSQLSGSALYYSRGAKFNLAANQTNPLNIGSHTSRMTLTGTLNEGSTLHADSAGILEIPVNQTVATLEGTDNAASVDIASGKVLTLNGVDGETVYDGSLTGSGTLVKKGTDYSLVFDGNHTTNHPFAGNVRIDEGALSLKKDKTFTETVTPTLYWSFDDPDNPGAPDVGSLSFKSYTWNNGHVASDVNLSAPGVRGKGVRPNGTVFLSTGNQGSMPRTNNVFSILIWAKIDANATGAVQLFGWGSRVGKWGDGCRLLVNSGGAIEVHTAYNNNYKVLESDGTVSYRDGKWHQYGLVYEGSSTSTLTLYVDGESMVSGNISFAISNWTYFDLGITSTGSSGSRTPCDVSLDELGVYRYTALTAEQIAACYGQFRSRAMAETGTASLPSPVAWYRFDDETQVGKDSSGNGYHLDAFAGSASGGTMKAPEVNMQSPIHGGMYNSRGGNGHLKWSGESLPSGIPAKTEPMTVSLWFNASGSSIYNASQSWAVFQLGSIRLGSYFADPLRRFALMSASKTVTSYSPLWFIQTMERATAWHHAAYVSTGSSCKFYIDGKLVDTKSSVLSYDDSSKFIIGQGDNTLSEKYQYFKGYLDEVKIYAAALTDEQVVADYMSELPATGGVVDPASSYEVQSGAKLVVDGATQTFDGGVSGPGSVELKNDARLTLGASTFAGSLYGVGSVLVNSDLTLSGSMEFGPYSAVEVTNAVLTVAQGGTLAAPVVLRAGGKLSAAGVVDADVTIKAGGCLDFASPLTTTGVLALEPGFVVDCGGNEYRTWTTIATASKVEATQAVLDSVVFENKTQNAVGELRLVDGTTLQARNRSAKGIVIIVQ